MYGSPGEAGVTWEKPVPLGVSHALPPITSPPTMFLPGLRLTFQRA